MRREPQSGERRSPEDTEGRDPAVANLDRKFWLAMALFGFLALMVWFTVGEGKVLVFGKPVEIRFIPLVVLGGLAVRTMLARQADKIRRTGKGSGN